MNDYKPNSYKFKEEQKESNDRKPVEKMVKGPVKVKKNEMRKLADVFISEDVKNVKSYVLMDVLVPTIKKAIVDIVSDGINMIFFGGTGTRRGGSTNASYVSYRSYSDRNSNSRGYSDNRTRSGYSYNDIILDNRGEAEEVLRRMDELIEQYQVVSVADLYDLVGISGEYTDNKYGWTNLTNASVERVRDGYLLKLPKALPIT